MNDHPPLEPVGDASLEARIVAWVLGEASAFEAGELERLCDERPELLVFRRRMRALHGLLSEAESSEPDDAWKLPPDKRAKIEELFGESQPEPEIPVLRPAAPRRWLLKTILTAAACVMFGMLYRFGFEERSSMRVAAKSVDFMPPAATNGNGRLSGRVEITAGSAFEVAPQSQAAGSRTWYGRSDENGVAGNGIDGIKDEVRYKVSQSEFDADRKPAAGADYSYKAKAAQAVADSESLALDEKAKVSPTGGIVGELHAGYNSQYIFRGKDLNGGAVDDSIAPSNETLPQPAGLAFGTPQATTINPTAGTTELERERFANGDTLTKSDSDGSLSSRGIEGIPAVQGQWYWDGKSTTGQTTNLEAVPIGGMKNDLAADRSSVGMDSDGEADPFADSSSDGKSRLAARRPVSESKPGEPTGQGAAAEESPAALALGTSVGQTMNRDFGEAIQKTPPSQGFDGGAGLGFGGGSGGGGGGRAENAPIDEVSSLGLETKTEGAFAYDAGSISDLKTTGSLAITGKSELGDMEGGKTQVAAGTLVVGGTSVIRGQRSGDGVITRELADLPAQPSSGPIASPAPAPAAVAPPVVAAPAKPASANAKESKDSLSLAEPGSRRLDQEDSVAGQKADLAKSMAAEPRRNEQALQSLEKGNKNWGLTDDGAKKPAPTAQPEKKKENAVGDRGAASAGEMEYKIEQDKVQLESQLKGLLNYSNDQLLTYASGLDLPENSIKALYPSYLEQKRALDEMKTKGFADEHPAVRAQKEQIENTKKQLEEGVTSLRETVMAQHDMASERLAKVKILSSEKKGEAIDTAVDSQDYIDARRELDTAQETLNHMKEKLLGETIQERIPSNSIVVHEDPVIEKPGWLSLDRRYQSSAVVQVKPRTPGITVPGSETSGSSGQPTMSPQFFATEFEIVKSRNVLMKVAEQLGLSNKWEIPKEKVVEELQKSIEISNRPGTDLIDIKVKNDDAGTARDVAAEVAKAYKSYRAEIETKDSERALQELRKAVREQEDKVEERRKLVTTIVRTKGIIPSSDLNKPSPPAVPKPTQTPAPIPTDETSASGEAFSTFSLHVSDASFKVAKAALDRGERPDPESVRPEEFYNAFDYGDPTPAPGEPVACAIEQAAHPILPERNLVRIAMRTGAAGRAASQPLNLTVLLDHSGSMEREDRHEGLNQAIVQLASLLKAGDTITVAGFSRTPRLMADRLPGERAKELIDIVRNTPSEGGTNLEEALKLGGDLALRQKNPAAQNRIVLLTDGAANLGNAKPEDLAERIRALRQQGVSFDAAGLGAGGVNDRMLETLTRDGNGRYYLIDQPSDADANFARQLAGAFRPAAENVKVQVHFNPARVGRYKLIGFEKHRLKTEDFRNDKVDAAELAAEEAGIAIYQVEPLPQGTGEIGEASVRFKDTSTGQMVEQTWTIPYDEKTPAFDQAAPSMQLASLAALSAEKLRGGPLAEAIDFQSLTPQVAKVRAHYATSKKVGDLIEMIGKLK